MGRCNTFFKMKMVKYLTLTPYRLGLIIRGVGPEHSYLKDAGLVEYTFATDDEVIEAFRLLSRLEGIIPALESSHALAHALKIAPQMKKERNYNCKFIRSRR